MKPFNHNNKITSIDNYIEQDDAYLICISNGSKNHKLVSFSDNFSYRKGDKVIYKSDSGRLRNLSQIARREINNSSIKRRFFLGL